MTASWMFGSTTLADIELKTLLADPGLGLYRLLAQIDITLHNKKAEEKITVTNIEGELQVRGQTNREFYLGYLRRQGAAFPLETYPDVNKTMVTLEVDLTPGQIAALENIRLGRDLFFKLNIFGLGQSEQEKRPQPMLATLDHRVNQSAWIEILNQLGYRQTMLLEIPIVDNGKSNPQFAEAGEYLQTAQDHLLRGHYRDAVGACRDVIEALSTALNDEKDQSPEAVKTWFDGTRPLGKEERIRLIRRAFKIFTHPARHADQVATSIDWDPIDARAAIIIAATLLQLASGKQ